MKEKNNNELQENNNENSKKNKELSIIDVLKKQIKEIKKLNDDISKLEKKNEKGADFSEAIEAKRNRINEIKNTQQEIKFAIFSEICKREIEEFQTVSEDGLPWPISIGIPTIGVNPWGDTKNPDYSWRIPLSENKTINIGLNLSHLLKKILELDNDKKHLALCDIGISLESKKDLKLSQRLEEKYGTIQNYMKKQLDKLEEKENTANKGTQDFSNSREQDLMDVLKLIIAIDENLAKKEETENIEKTERKEDDGEER